ncbi:epoxide hydrolase [Saccharibacillus sp. CPCC 101409]|uniref:epoxide hydrolase family protein n=1 Tax=Saccharibacillus sp. CPCC 101409 TaxID=3058041 RepID=UPI00267335D2|nr:epoxide hydrolase family protein [Saccharibacillus sp. CPCC 101409]MDO3412632.1 epoxide hydrolase [Saccharibacillus sp. CPCC 101409]
MRSHSKSNPKFEPFTVRFDERSIEDLRRRLDLTRWPDELPGAGWSYGIPLDTVREAVHYWSHEFDWRLMHEQLNAFEQFTVEIDGLSVHFVHARGRGANPQPLLLLHGWPSTYAELLDLIPYLTDPQARGGEAEESFDVVIPSIPGHGFSGIPAVPGFEDRQAASIMVKLMDALGYTRFCAHGYDLGASILGLLCLDYPERVIGYHTTSPGNPGPYLDPAIPLSEAEREHVRLGRQWYAEEGGYAHILGTRPQTMAYGLQDSPTALASFILEKWHLWTAPPGGDLFRHFDPQKLLTHVSIYWMTGTANASGRFYYEGRHTRWPGPGDISQVPLGVSLTRTQAHERPPIEYVRRMFPDIRSWEEIGSGGHFVAAERPEQVAGRILDFFRLLL